MKPNLISNCACFEIEPTSVWICDHFFYYLQKRQKNPRTYQPVMYLSQLRSDSSKFILRVSLSWSKETASECILLERASDSCYPILVIHFRTVPFVPMHSATMQVCPREETPNKSRDLHVPHLHLRTRSS